MAAPLRMSFSHKFHQISRLFPKQTTLPNSVNLIKWIPSRPLHNADKSFSGNGYIKNKLWVKICGGTVVMIAAATTVLSVGSMVIPFYEAASRRTKVAAADSQVQKPNHRISREMKMDTDNTGLKLTLYQYQTCPFCCKVRAFLDYHGISYNIVEVNSVTRKQLKWTKYRKVPILVVEDVGENGFLQLNDSSVIISILKTYLHHRNKGAGKSIDQIRKCYPVLESTEKKKTVYEYPNKYFIMYFDEESDKNMKSTYKEERQWRAWTDTSFVHALSPNIYRTLGEAYHSFQYFSTVGNWETEFSMLERALVVYVGSIAMYFVGKMLKKRHNLDEDVRLSLYHEANVWMKAVGNGRRFMGGDEPNLADLSVYGSLVAIEGCDAFTDLMEDNGCLKTWYSAMKETVSNHGGNGMTSAES